METETTLIRNVRRKVVIDRHRPVIADTEASLSDGFIDGTLAHPRLQAMLRELEEESEQNRIHATVAKLLKDPAYLAFRLQDALVEYLCMMREDHDTEVTTLQLHAVGVYRAFKAMIKERRGWSPAIEDLRDLTLATLCTINGSGRVAFASIGFAKAMACPPGLCQRTASAIRAIRSNPEQAPRWEDDTQAQAVPRELEEQVAELPEAERKLALKDLLADKVRSAFYHKVFLQYFTADEFDPSTVAGLSTLLDWVAAIRETPQLFPFMQGQNQEQKNFRLANLVTKLLQLCEMYQRVTVARQDPAFSERLEGKNTRECLGVLAKEKYPACTVDDAFIAACFLYPLLDFVSWVQGNLEANDLVLPPEPRNRRGVRGTISATGSSSRIQQAAIE
jgi:hypothetical protein